MGFGTALTLFSIVLAVIYLAYKFIQNQDQTKSYMLKPVYIVDLKDGTRVEGDVDYMNPQDFIRFDPKAGKQYIKRKKGMFDRGPDNYYLSKVYEKIEYPGYYLLLDNITQLTDYAIHKVIDQEKEIIHLKNSLSMEKALRIQAETHKEKAKRQDIEFASEMIKATNTYLGQGGQKK